MIPKTKLEKIMFSDPGHYNYTDFVKEYINENYSEDISLTEACAGNTPVAGISFGAVQERGRVQLQEYLISMRMDKARELITSGASSLLRAAQSVGYKDYAQFSKMYKKYHGFSPRVDLPNQK